MTLTIAICVNIKKSNWSAVLDSFLMIKYIENPALSLQGLIVSWVLCILFSTKYWDCLPKVAFHFKHITSSYTNKTQWLYKKGMKGYLQLFLEIWADLSIEIIEGTYCGLQIEHPGPNGLLCKVPQQYICFLLKLYQPSWRVLQRSNLYNKSSSMAAHKTVWSNSIMKAFPVLGYYMILSWY